MSEDQELADLALRFALQNAIEHEGEANPGAVIGRIMSYDERFKEDPKAVAQAAGKAAGQIKGLSVEEQEAKLAELGEIEMAAKDTRREGLPELPGADEVDRVVMRFAPNPNGPPTLGHSRGMCVNGWYADHHDGELILRFDDTDPVNKPPWEPAYGYYEEAFDWLGIDVAKVLCASDRLDTYYEHARNALEMGAAYVCTCEAETFRELKNQAEPCPHREDPVDTQLERWEQMLAGGYRAGGAVVRVKTEIGHKDPALRDWVALRIVDIETHPHARTGRDHHVWPMLDFQSAVEDHLQGVTHIIRGKDLMDSERKQAFLYDHFGWEYPEVLHWGRVSVHEFGKFSTSGLREAIEAGTYTGWDDPRLPTLAALARRGFLPEAIMAFWVNLGLSEKDIAISAETLEAENRKLLDDRADRAFFIAGPAALRVRGLEGALTAQVPRHPDHEDRGTRALVIEEEVLVREKDLAGIEQGTVFRLKDGADLELTGPGQARFVAQDPTEQRTGPIIQWCPAPGIPCRVLKPDGTEDEGVVEPTVLEAEAGAVVQFERYGFVRLETVDEEGVVAIYTHG